MIKTLNILISQSKISVGINYTLLLLYFTSPFVKAPVNESTLNNTEFVKTVLVEDFTIVSKKNRTVNKDNLKENEQKNLQIGFNEISLLNQLPFCNFLTISSDIKNTSKFIANTSPRSPPSIVS